MRLPLRGIHYTLGGMLNFERTAAHCVSGGLRASRIVSGWDGVSRIILSSETMALYQLTFCYPYLKEYAVTVHHIRDEIETLSGSDWRIVSSGEHVCAIVFETNAEPEQLVHTLGSYGSDEFQFLLTEVSAALAGYLPPEVWEWIDGRFPRTLKLL